jgi:hypothetical protein
MGCSDRCPPGTTQMGDACVRQHDTSGDGADGAGMSGALTNGVDGNDSAGDSVGGASAARSSPPGSGGPTTGSAGSGTAGTGGGPSNLGVGGAPGPALAGGGIGGVAAAGAAAGSDGTHTASADLCKSRAGQAVCDEQGGLTVCNADGTVAMQQACLSARHCMAGLPSKACGICVPKEEFSCTGKTLAVCADDGQSFTKQKDCETEALCNKIAGMCTSAVCAPGKAACDANTLTQCNADGTAFQNQTPCPAGTTCDGAGGDCNICEPGMKKCAGSMVGTCNAAGQGYDPTPCPSDTKCSDGICVACATDDDCSAIAKDCKVGICQGNVCATKNAGDGIACTALAKAGTCSGGVCQCTPQCSGKECGDNGCGTGTTCAPGCSGGQQCNKENRCVECLTAADCNGKTSQNGCGSPMCSPAGTCGTLFAPSGQSCGTGTNKCDGAGACKVCTTSCAPNSCGGSDGCGGTCTCAGQAQCSASGTCVTASTSKGLYETCDAGTGLQGNCAANLACVGVAGRGSHCFAVKPCAATAVTVFNSVCAEYCTTDNADNPTPNSSCPAAANLCFSNTDTFDVKNDGFCIP